MLQKLKRNDNPPSYFFLTCLPGVSFEEEEGVAGLNPAEGVPGLIPAAGRWGVDLAGEETSV